nr:hypothetical protein [Tanacetum cinerariifolium]
MAYQGCLAWAPRIKYFIIHAQEIRYGISDLLDTAYRTSSIWRIRLIGYGILGSSNTVYRVPWVRRIGSLGIGYGVSSFLGTEYGLKIIMVNVIPTNNVDDVPVVEPDQHDDVPIVLEPVLVDEDKDPKEDEFEEGEDPQEKENNMEVDIKEYENEPELTYPYEEIDPLNPLSPAFESEPKDTIEVENPIEHKDETVPTSVHKVGESSTAPLLCEDSDVLLPSLNESREISIGLEQVNVRNKASGSRPVRGQDAAPATRECTFAGFMKCNPTAFYGTEGAVELLRWFEKTESVFGISECAEGKKVRFAIVTLQGPNLTWWNAKIATRGFETMNRMPWTKMKHLMTVEFCPIEEIQRMEHELWNLKVKEYNIMAYTQRPANLNEAVHMAHKLMDQKAQARDERILEEKSESGGAFKMEIVVARAIKGITHCTIKCHKYGKVGQKSRYCKEKNVATSANALPIPTCYDCGKQGHTRKRYPRKVKQEEVVKVRGRAYAIKDAEPKGLNVVTSTFLLNNRYTFILFDSGFDRSFLDTRFNFVLDIDPVKIGAC